MMANRMKKFIVISAILLQWATPNASAQINPMIPLMVRPPQFNFPDPLQQAMQIEQIRALRIQNEQAEAQRRAIEAQARNRDTQAQPQVNSSGEQQSRTSGQLDPVIDEWLKAAAPRMGLYPDFEKVVFAPDVTITVDMIRLMTPSPLAADIAYYLGTHKMESLAISKLSLIEAARSIDRIESQLKARSAP